MHRMEKILSSFNIKYAFIIVNTVLKG